MCSFLLDYIESHIGPKIEELQILSDNWIIIFQFAATYSFLVVET